MATTPLFKDLVKRVDPYFAKTLGGSDVARSGLWGNVWRESRGRAEAKESANPNLGGVGIMQHTGPRRRALQAFAATRGQDETNLGAQVDYTARELLGVDPKFDFSHAWHQTCLCTTPEAAAETFMDYFEKPAPATAGLAERQEGARDALAVIRATQQAQPAPIAQEAKPMADTPSSSTTVMPPAGALTPAGQQEQLANIIRGGLTVLENFAKTFAVSKGVPAVVADGAIGLINKVDIPTLVASKVHTLDWPALITKLFHHTVPQPK